MVTRWGMSPKVGLVYVARGDDGFLGPESALVEGRDAIGDLLANLVDTETQRIIDECYATAHETLVREGERLVALAEALLRHESLDEAQIERATGLAGGGHTAQEAQPRPSGVVLPAALAA